MSHEGNKVLGLPIGIHSPDPLPLVTIPLVAAAVTFDRILQRLAGLLCACTLCTRLARSSGVIAVEVRAVALACGILGVLMLLQIRRGCWLPSLCSHPPMRPPPNPLQCFLITPSELLICWCCLAVAAALTALH